MKGKSTKGSDKLNSDYMSDAMSSNDKIQDANKGENIPDTLNLMGKQATKEIAKMNQTRQKLEQTIKNNNIDKQFGIDDAILNKKYEDIEVIDEKKELLDTLKDLRKKHDQLLEICKQKQKDIVHMKDNINTIKAKEDQILKDKSDADRKLSDLQATLANLKGKLEEAVQNKKTYEHMLENMKRDQIINQRNSNRLEEDLRKEEHLNRHNQELLLQSRRHENDTR